MTDLAPLWALCTLNDDTLKDSTPPDFTFEYVDISNVTEGHISDDLETMSFGAAPSRARRLAQPDDIIISTVRTYLRAIARVDATESQRVYSTGFAVLRPVQGVTDPRYLAYVLTSDRVMDEIIATSVGVSYPAIQGSVLHRIGVPPRDLDSQRTIANYLDRETGEIDAMIGALDQLGVLLSHLSHVYLVSLGRRLTQASSGNRVKLGLLLTKLSRELLKDDGVVTAFRDGQVALRSRRREEGFTMSFSEHGYQGVMPGDFVFHGLDGFSGAVGVSEDRGKVSPVYHVCAATPLASEQFMAWALRALSANGFLETYSSSVRQRSIDFRNWATFAGLPINYISLDEQCRIADHLDEVTGKIDGMLVKVAELKSLLIERRAALITDVVTGRKKVA